jgi:hypothetical protein
MPIMTEAGGASKQQRGYIIGLARKLQATLPIESAVVARVERLAKVGEMTEAEAATLIDVLQKYLGEEVDNRLPHL